MVLSVEDYLPGEYNLSVTVENSDGQSVDILLESLQLRGLFDCVCPRDIILISSVNLVHG